MSIKMIATILLLERFVSVVFLSLVLHRQWKLFRATRTKLTTVRETLLVLVSVALLGNIVPIIIDLVTITGEEYAGKLLVPYAFSNATTVTIISVGWWYLYRSIAKDGANLQKENDRLTAQNVKLRKNNRAKK